MPKLAANLSWLFQDRPLPERVAAAAACGFRGVEILFPYDEIDAARLAGLLDAAGLELVLINAPAGDWAAGERGFAAIPGAEGRFQKSLETALDYAAASGVRRVHVLSGLAAGDDAADTLAANLHAALPLAEAAGVTLLLEPLNNHDVPGYFLRHFDDAVSLVAACASPFLKLQADLYHIQIMDGDLTRRLTAHAGLIGHVQIAGVPERGEPDRGELAIDHLLHRLDEIGYTGWVGLEYRPAGRTEDGLGWARRWGITA